MVLRGRAKASEERELAYRGWESRSRYWEELSDKIPSCRVSSAGCCLESPTFTVEWCLLVLSDDIYLYCLMSDGSYLHWRMTHISTV